MSVLCLLAVYSVVSIKDTSCMPAGVISARGLGGAGGDRRGRAEVVHLERASKEEKHFYEMYPDALENRLAMRELDEVKESSGDAEDITPDEPDEHAEHAEVTESSGDAEAIATAEPDSWDKSAHSADDDARAAAAAAPVEGHSGESIPEDDTQQATRPARDNLHTRCTLDSPSSAEVENRTLVVEVDFVTEDEALTTDTTTTTTTTGNEQMKQTKTTEGETTVDGGDNAVEQTTESKAPYASPAAYTFTETGFIDDD